MSIAPILQRFIDDELALAPALIGRVALGTIQLLGPSKEAAGTSERFHYADIVTALQGKAALYEKAFVDSLRRQIAEDLDSRRPIARRRDPGRQPQPRADGRIARRGRHRDLARHAADRQHRRMGAARAPGLHVDAEGPKPRDRRVEPVSTARLRDRVVGRRLGHRRLADPARDLAAHLGRRCRRPAEERRRGGVDAAGIAGRRAGPVSHRRAAVGIGLRPSGRRAAAPGSAERPARPHAGRGRCAGRRCRRRRTAAAIERRHQRRPRTPQRRGRAAKPRARAGAAAARRIASPPRARNLAIGKGNAQRADRAASLGRSRERKRARRSTGDRARHAPVRIAARRFVAAGRLSPRDLAHAGRHAARLPRRSRGARFVRASGLAPARPHRRDQPGLHPQRGSAALELPRLRRRRRRGDGRRRGARHRPLPARPEPDRHLPLRAAAGPAARRPRRHRRAAARRAPRRPAAASDAAHRRPDGRGAHVADDPPLHHRGVGTGDRRRHASPRRAVGSDDERAQDGRRSALEPEDPGPSAEPATAHHLAARAAAADPRRHGRDRPARGRAAGRSRRADGDPHRGASSGHARSGRCRLR